MNLLCLGLSHHTAPLALREKLAMGETALQVFLNEQLSTGKVGEIAVLSTCNRVEIYFTSSQSGFDQMIEDLAAANGVKPQELKVHSYGLKNDEGVRHLFRVAAGLDSLVVGEAQILGQVAQAYEFARAHQTVGLRLSKLFQAAIFSAKRVQSETALSRLSTSVPSLAVKLASRQGKRLDQAHILLVGAGEMAELAVEAFRKHGVKRFSVASRTLHSAEKLARRWNGRAGTLDQLSQYLADVDVLLCSSSSQDFLIDKEMVDQVMSIRPQRPLVILDIAVPRDVHPDVKQVKNVFLYDMDDLQQGVEVLQSARSRELPRARQIVDEEVRDFIAYSIDLDVMVPVIRGLRQQAENIRHEELQKTLRRLPNLTPEQQEQIGALTRSIVRKLLHNPTAHLRQRTTDENNDRYAAVARQLFGLDQE
ncbi:MAG TPA: glutamyl-tRNA reductase [Anaerolineales bacterium]|jgi:glutamyl-tRNA reductase|nr:glutamyl-tRNA reductase [Anaerolineales bacterium]